ncbi:MAG: VanZ family protein [Clostridia bacterium]|nr:VanZ family protein [Clostridia bacterium]
MNKTLVLRIVSVILLIATATAIFIFSSEPAKESKKTSGGVVRVICRVLYPDFENKTFIEKAEIIKSVQRPVRKAAHMTIYAVFAIFAFLSAISYKALPLYIRLALSYGFCLLYAVGDEIHQSFVPGRAGRASDVIIDLIGVTVSTTLMLYIFKKYSFSEKINNEPKR